MPIYTVCAFCDDEFLADYDLDRFGRRVYNFRQRVCDVCRYGPPTPGPRDHSIRRRLVREDDLEGGRELFAEHAARRREVVRKRCMEVDLLCSE